AGAKLSGGQRQRLALARAILRDPAILILDEFTSQCDAESEALIHQALRTFMHDRTTFVITPPLTTREIAARIVVLDRGGTAPPRTRSASSATATGCNHGFSTTKSSCKSPLCTTGWPPPAAGSVVGPWMTSRFGCRPRWPGH